LKSPQVKFAVKAAALKGVSPHRASDQPRNSPDEFVPDPVVIKEFGITAMSVWRWDRDPELIALGWPPPIKIRTRKFRSRRALDEFKAGLVRRAIEERVKA
jgi:hypothetical protein